MNRFPSAGRLTATVMLASAMALGGAAAAARSAAPVPSGSPSSLSVDGAWVRVSPMVDLPDAGYMVIHNVGTTDTALVGVTTPAARVVELHETAPTSSGGMMMMQPLGSIPVPAGSAVALQPGGYHLMLIDLAAPLPAGASVDMTLTFQDGTVLTASAMVRSDPPSASPMPMGSASPMPMDPTMPMATPMPMGSAAP